MYSYTNGLTLQKGHSHSKDWFTIQYTDGDMEDLSRETINNILVPIGSGGELPQCVVFD